MLSHTILEFVTHVNQYHKLTGLSTLQIPDENSRATIIGILANHEIVYGNAGPVIGAPGPVYTHAPSEWRIVRICHALYSYVKSNVWDRHYVRHFEIDGKGGERVVEVHVTHDHRSIKVVTNRGREGVFGEQGNGKEWHVKRAEEGEVIVGLSACFGDLGGWNKRVGLWSHWGLSNVGVFVARGEE
jgi:hypothetical protein